MVIETFYESIKSERRNKLIEYLVKKKFSKIGGSCLRPELCRVY